ncbi:MAG: hypothetical protein Aurels2KO_38260 [Aureliella sp.]
MRVATLAMLAASVAAVVPAQSSFAQTRSQRAYQPARPTISPYTGLTQSNFGALPNYFSIVRPQLEQRSFNRRIQTTTRFQALSIQNVENRETPEVVRTGRSAGFENYLHYYQPIRLRERRR